MCKTKEDGSSKGKGSFVLRAFLSMTSHTTLTSTIPIKASSTNHSTPTTPKSKLMYSSTSTDDVVDEVTIVTPGTSTSITKIPSLTPDSATTLRPAGIFSTTKRNTTTMQAMAQTSNSSPPSLRSKTTAFHSGNTTLQPTQAPSFANTTVTTPPLPPVKSAKDGGPHNTAIVAVASTISTFIALCLFTYLILRYRRRSAPKPDTITTTINRPLSGTHTEKAPTLSPTRTDLIEANPFFTLDPQYHNPIAELPAQLRIGHPKSALEPFELPDTSHGQAQTSQHHHQQLQNVGITHPHLLRCYPTLLYDYAALGPRMDTPPSREHNHDLDRDYEPANGGKPTVLEV